MQQSRKKYQLHTYFATCLNRSPRSWCSRCTEITHVHARHLFFLSNRSDHLTNLWRKWIQKRKHVHVLYTNALFRWVFFQITQDHIYTRKLIVNWLILNSISNWLRKKKKKISTFFSNFMQKHHIYTKIK